MVFASILGVERPRRVKGRRSEGEREKEAGREGGREGGREKEREGGRTLPSRCQRRPGASLPQGEGGGGGDRHS
jgi:hypothetical protein